MRQSWGASTWRSEQALGGFVFLRLHESRSDRSHHSAYFNRPSSFLFPGIKLSAPLSIRPQFGDTFYALYKNQLYQGLVRSNGSGVEVPMWFDHLLESSCHLHYENLLGALACRSGPPLTLNSLKLARG